MSGIEQTQALALQKAIAPYMQQRLQILQASLSDLKQLIGNEMRRNPTLEEVVALEEYLPSEKDASWLQETWDTYYAQSAVASQRTVLRQNAIHSLVEPNTLQRFLREQVSLMEIKENDINIALMIVGSLNEAGYLEASVEDISYLTETCPKNVEAILHQVQSSLDPAGIAARNLQECLLLQLERQGKERHLESRIVKCHLNQLAGRKLNEIARTLQVPLIQVRQAANHITQLDPKPGRALAEAATNFVFAEVIVQKRQDGKYYTLLNAADFPHLRINVFYKELLLQSEHNKEVQEYLRKKVQMGRFLIHSIQQRQQTVLNIAKQIVSRQQKFFEEGTVGLRPMTMGEIAKATGMHESTVSRAVSGKYMDTPQGTLEMKFFFTSGYRTKNGDPISSVSVRRKISEIIAEEDTDNPLSDQEIVISLKEKGFPVARRTIAKYREQLSILPSYLRKTLSLSD